MDKNKFDIHAKGLLDGLETPINTDALWDNVHAELYPEKKKKFGWIWFGAAGIMAILLISTYVYMYTHASVEQGLSMKDNAAQQIEATDKSKVIEVTTVDTKMPETKIDAIEEKSERQTMLSIVAKNKSNLVQEAKETSIELAVKTKNKSSKANESANIRNIEKSKEQVVHNSILSTSTKNTEKIKEVKTEAPKKNKADRVIMNTEDSEKYKAPHKTETPTIKQSKDETKDLIIASVEAAEEEVAERLLDMSEEESDDENLSRKFKRNFQFGVGFRTGISNSLTRLSAKSDDDIALRVLRSQSEKNLETIDLGLDMLVKHKSGLYLSVGLDYLKATRKLEFNSEVIDRDSVLGIAAIYVNPISMDTTFQEGYISQTVTTTRTKEIYNNLHLINIPVNLGISLDYQQWIFGVQGGASLNMYVKQKGQIRSGEASFYDIGEDGENWFRDNLDLSFQGAALVGYNFTDNFQIVGGPSFRSAITLSEDINPIKQSQVGLGFQVNARYWFD
jgi:hypothetical protein